MKRTKLKFWSCVWRLSLFVLSSGSFIAEGCASDFEIIPKSTASLTVELAEGEVSREFENLTRFVGERTQKNFEEALEEIELFLHANLGEELFGGELTQVKTVSMISQRFFKGQEVENLDLHSIKRTVLLLRPYEMQIGDDFLDLQGFYRKILLEERAVFDVGEDEFLSESRAIFYFSDNSHRPYLVPDQANWILRLAKKYVIGGDEFQGYLERAIVWQKKQKKRELLSSSSASDGYSASITSSSDETFFSKRKWGNKGFHSHTGLSAHRSVYKQRYGGGKKGMRPRSASW